MLKAGTKFRLGDHIQEKHLHDISIIGSDCDDMLKVRDGEIVGVFNVGVFNRLGGQPFGTSYYNVRFPGMTRMPGHVWWVPESYFRKPDIGMDDDRNYYETITGDAL